MQTDSFKTFGYEIVYFRRRYMILLNFGEFARRLDK